MLQLCTIVATLGHDVKRIHLIQCINRWVTTSQNTNVLGLCWSTMRNQSLNSNLHISGAVLEIYTQFPSIGTLIMMVKSSV